MLASTVSSMILKTMAKEEGFNFIETLTGFKWMGKMNFLVVLLHTPSIGAFVESVVVVLIVNVVRYCLTAIFLFYFIYNLSTCLYKTLFV